MDSDDWPGSEDCKFIMPLDLIMRPSGAMLDILDEWHEDNNREDMDLQYCQALMLAATAASVHSLAFGESNGTMQ